MWIDASDPAAAVYPRSASVPPSATSMRDTSAADEVAVNVFVPPNSPPRMFTEAASVTDFARNLPPITVTGRLPSAAALTSVSPPFTASEPVPLNVTPPENTFCTPSSVLIENSPPLTASAALPPAPLPFTAPGGITVASSNAPSPVFVNVPATLSVRIADTVASCATSTTAPDENTRLLSMVSSAEYAMLTAAASGSAASAAKMARGPMKTRPYPFD